MITQLNDINLTRA
uniref:Uncharacterized protein n=1 Tax=Anguilla anguilla TaxID=7936 RepID=A0A0E9TUH7_ANGAN